MGAVPERRKRASERAGLFLIRHVQCKLPSAVFHEGVRQMVEQKRGHDGRTRCRRRLAAATHA